MQNLANLSNLSGLGVSGRRLKKASFSPQSLFVSGEKGVWFDPSDMSTLFQDSLGTIPVTGVEQPVGLMLDKSNSQDPKIHTISGVNIYQTEGLLYNHPAALLAPPYGTKLPSDEEWYTLENYLKDEGQTCDASRSAADCSTAGTKLKVGGSSGMNIPLAGNRGTGGTFGSRGSYANLWSSSISGTSAWSRYLGSASTGVGRVPYSQAGGFSVRCLIDTSVLPDFVAGSTITDARDGQTYGTVQVGTQIWLTENIRYFGSDVPIRNKEQGSTTVPMAYVYNFSNNHAFQATSASRPTLSARVNMLVNTDTLSTQNVTVAKQDYTLRFEGSGSVRDTVPLGQTTRNWVGMTTLGSDVYATVSGGDIYKQTGGTGNFVALSQTSRNWRGMTTLGSDVYATVLNGDIYKQTGGTGNFEPLNQTERNWWGMTTLGSDVYATVLDGDIYKQTGGTGDFEPLNQTSRNWTGMTTLGSDVYASVYNGDIYKQTGGTGDFVALGQTSRLWRGMTTLGSDVYATVDNGDIYKQTGGTGDFVALGQTSRNWRGMTTLGSDVYAVAYGGDIYKMATPKTAGSYTIPSGAGAMRLVVSGSVSNADLRSANVGNLPPYQRVGNVGTTPSDYNDVGFPKYLRFDGVDDDLETNAIDFSSTDEMNVFAGVRKESDVVDGIFCEISTNRAANNGAFSFISPGFAGAGKYVFASKGTSDSFVRIDTTYIAPITNILTGTAKISADTAKLRVDGSQVAQSSSDQGIGNYGNYPLYIGARGGTSLFFVGNLYQLLVRGKLSTDSQVRGTERFISKKTGL